MRTSIRDRVLRLAERAAGELAYGLFRIQTAPGVPARVDALLGRASGYLARLAERLEERHLLPEVSALLREQLDLEADRVACEAIERGSSVNAAGGVS